MFEMSEYSRKLYASVIGRLFHKKRLRKLLRLCRHLQGTEVLEIGCHDLLFYHCLNKHYRRYVGVDANWEGWLDFARKNKRQLGWQNVEIIEAVAESLPLANESFDLVLCFETIEHLSNEELAIAEITRVLKPGGTLVISVPIEFGLLLLVKVVMRAILRRKTDYTVAELARASLLWRPDTIERDGHKGYDYRRTIEYLNQSNIDVCKLHRYPFRWLPDWLNMGVIAVFTKS